MSEFLTVFRDAFLVTAAGFAVVVLPVRILMWGYDKLEYEIPEWLLAVLMVVGGLSYVSMLIAAIEVWWAP